MNIVRFCGIACFASGLCFGQTQQVAWNACTDLPKTRAATEASSALDRIIGAVGFDPGLILLYASTDGKVAEYGGAMSLICDFGDVTEKWIVYDPDLIKGDLARDFAFAHETAHHVNNHPSPHVKWTKQEELEADYYGAEYLVRLNLTKEQLLGALDQLKLPQGSQQGYPTLEERRASVIGGFDHENRHTTVAQPVTGAPAPTVSAVPSQANSAAEQHLVAGNARYAAGDWVGAIPEFREAIRLKPDLAEAHCGLGLGLGKEGNWDGDIREEREAIRLKPDLAEAHMGLGVALEHKAYLNGLISEEREAIRLKPDLAEAHYDLGVALGAEGDWDGDIKEQKEVTRLKPDFAPAHKELGEALEGKGSLQAALTEYRKACTLDQRNQAYRLDYDRLAKQLGEK
jgi:tetratricopeptide (TPR) repeat protein